MSSREEEIRSVLMKKDKAHLVEIAATSVFLLEAVLDELNKRGLNGFVSAVSFDIVDQKFPDLPLKRVGQD